VPRTFLNLKNIRGDHAVCVSICACPSACPPYFKPYEITLSSAFSFPNFYYEAHEIALLSMCFCVPSISSVFYAVPIVWKESRPLILSNFFVHFEISLFPVWVSPPPPTILSTFMHSLSYLGGLWDHLAICLSVYVPNFLVIHVITKKSRQIFVVLALLPESWEKKIWSRVRMGLGTNNDCAAEDQQKFTRRDPEIHVWYVIRYSNGHT
jgi:hypothetical protein